ncbi:hypothetical protein MKW98_026099 [Papaver atlanticum]|uniref:Uncharacterized protein n=1 Tax=Papaver atlanticum TaxID=357466 RepID=A0AAD4X4R4_9MAGN|nr:hypothetical protein MKW98_026099 [Papaver atlanticum]
MAMMCGDNHVPRRCVAILVGQKQERFVILVTYLNHPKFMSLLKEAEEVYGFRHKSNIILPCDVDEFLNVQSLIEQETMSCSPRHHNYHQHHYNPHHRHHFLHGCCFIKAFEGCFEGLIRLV